MHVLALQYDIAWEDKAANHRRVESMLEEADVPPGSFVLLPELGDTGFSFNLDTIVDEQTQQWASDLARRYRIWLQPGYAERGSDGRGRNCAAIYGPDGECRTVYRKVHPFSFGREIEHFTGGERLVVERCPDAAVSPMICYDLRFPELWRLAVLNGAEVFTIGASWPSPRQSHWRALLIARAIENQAYVVAVNRVGDDPHLSYLGGSMIVDPKGEVLAEADDRPQVLEADLDLSNLRHWREKFPGLGDIHRELLGSFPVDVPMT